MDKEKFGKLTAICATLPDQCRRIFTNVEQRSRIIGESAWFHRQFKGLS